MAAFIILITLDSTFLWERQMPHWLFIWEAILSLRNYPVFKGPARMGWTAGPDDANHPLKPNLKGKKDLMEY